MSRYQLGWVALLATGLFSGCASSQMSRIDLNRDIYETWPIETRQAILDGKVEPGMTPDMVKVAWGRPTEIVTQSNTGDEVWVYKKGGTEPSVYYPPGTAGSGGIYGGGAGYPGGVYPGGGTGVSIGTGRGGTTIGTNTGIGIGSGGVIGGGGMGGMGGPVMTPGTPPEIREVVFRNGVVQRADAP